MRYYYAPLIVTPTGPGGADQTDPGQGDPVEPLAQDLPPGTNVLAFDPAVGFALAIPSHSPSFTQPPGWIEVSISTVQADYPGVI